MPLAIPLPQRQVIIRQHQQGLSLPQIAQQMGLSYWSVRQIWRQYRDRAEAGLAIHYDRCGSQSHRSDARIYRAACWLKRRHPTWGGGVIRVILQQRWPEVVIPQERTLQRWFQQGGLQPPRPQLPRLPRQRAQQVHEVWQLDGKSHIRLGNGESVSWLNIVDEYSGAQLSVEVFSLTGV